MEYIMIILIVIISILFIYIISEKQELKRVRKELAIVKNSDTNLLIHKKTSNKNINNIIKDINVLITEIKNKEIFVDKQHQILTKMMTNISHDLRTPLTSAMGYINIIMNNNLSKEEQLKELIIIEERLRRLEELIDSFFEFSKIISANEKPELHKINIVAIIEECIAHYYDDYITQNRQIIFKHPSHKINILSDKILLTRIFDNLISNALKHSDSDLEIDIFSDEYIRITFSNDLKIKDLDIDKIFDEFYTVDIARTKNNNGLGLAIVKEFTERLNGQIRAIKKEGKLQIIIELKNES